MHPCSRLRRRERVWPSSWLCLCLWRILPSILTALSCTGALHAADIYLYQGPYTRASSGAYLTESRSGEAAIFNAANLTATQSSFYGDLGLAHWNYSITPKDNPDNKGAMQSPALPLASLGGTLRPSRSFAFGAAFIPLGAPGMKTQIKQMPTYIGGTLSQVDTVVEQTSFKFALGGGFKASNAFRAGLGVIMHYDNRKISVLSETTGEPAMVNTQKSTYFTPRLGFSGRLASRLNWAFVYQPSVVSKYNITTTMTSGQSSAADGREYHAESYEVGGSLNLFHGITPYGQFVREQWVKGTFQSTSPTDRMNGYDGPTDFLDTNNFVVGVKIATKKHQALYLGFASYQGNKGNGLKDTDGSTLFAGAGPGDFDALGRLHYTIGYKMMIKKSTLLTYFSYISAVKLTTSDSPAPGYYDLKVLLLGGGYVMD